MHKFLAPITPGEGITESEEQLIALLSFLTTGTILAGTDVAGYVPVLYTVEGSDAQELAEYHIATDREGELSVDGSILKGTSDLERTLTSARVVSVSWDSTRYLLEIEHTYAV